MQRLYGKTPTPSFELLVVDGGSTDNTVSVAEKLGARVVHCTRGRARQMNVGASLATGESFYFLHADSLPPTDWSDHLNGRSKPLPACFRLSFGGARNRWLSLFGYLSRINIDAFRFGDQSLWVRREDFEAVGGFPDDWSLLEDNDMVRRLRRHCGGFEVLPAQITTSDRKYRRNGILYTQSVYVLLYSLYRLGVGQEGLRRCYRRLLR